MVDIQILEHALSVDACTKRVADDSAGGTTVFIGTVRNQTGGNEVIRLEFEAYVPMAIKEMQKIADQITSRWNAIHVVMHHRVGVLDIGEIPVIIAVSTPHRKAAFEACQFAIDTLKETVPIWKKEVFKNGEVWVAAHP
jgi:molybdopterin synthase catalytic subunit